MVLGKIKFVFLFSFCFFVSGCIGFVPQYHKQEAYIKIYDL